MRKTMIKTLAALAIVILILIPWTVGFIFKQRYYHFVDLLNKESGVKIEILQYHEGWLNSHAKVRISLLTSALTNLPDISLTAPISFDVDANIIHGPIIIDMRHGIVETGYAKINSTVLINKPETNMPVSFNSSGDIEIATVAELDGDWRGAIHVPSLSAAMSDFLRVVSNEINGNFRVIIRDDQIRHVLVQARLGAMILSDFPSSYPVRKIRLEALDYIYDTVHDNLGLWSGTTSMSTKGLDVQLENGSRYIFNGLNLNSKFGVSGVTFYNTTIGLNADLIKTPSAILPVVSDLHVSLSADNFSAEGMQSYIKFFRNKTPEAIKKVDLKTAESLMVHTIMPTSKLTSETSMNTSLGQLSLDTSSIWKADTAPPGSLEDVITNSETEIHLKVSDAIMRQVVTLYNENIRKAPTEKIVPVSPQTASNTLDQQLALLLQQGKISVSSFVQILNMEKENISAGTFADNIDHLALPPDVSARLKQTYQAEVANALRKQHNQLVINWSAPETLIHDMLMIGYITEEKNYYVATLTIENGEIKVGANLPPEAQ